MKIQEFLNYWEKKITEMPSEELEEMYKRSWKLSLDGREVQIPFDAVSYNAFVTALETILKEQ